MNDRWVGGGQNDQRTIWNDFIIEPFEFDWNDEFLEFISKIYCHSDSIGNIQADISLAIDYPCIDYYKWRAWANLAEHRPWYCFIYMYEPFDLMWMCLNV